MGELIFIGLGLYDEEDVSIKGKKLAKEADIVFSEFYTSSLAGCSIGELEEELDTEINILSREEVEEEGVPIEGRQDDKVAFLTPGDPMAATTHIDLRLRAEKKGFSTRIVHSSSVFSAAPSILGVQHYKFGKTVTLPFPKDKDYPKSPYTGIKRNKEMGLHSLVLLDINSVEEQFMSVGQGIDALLKLEDRSGEGVITDDTIMAGLARLGSQEPEIKAGYYPELLDHDFGNGLHSLVVFGDLHFMEIDALIEFANAPLEIKKERGSP